MLLHLFKIMITSIHGYRPLTGWNAAAIYTKKEIQTPSLLVHTRQSHSQYSMYFRKSKAEYAKKVVRTPENLHGGHLQFSVVRTKYITPLKNSMIESFQLHIAVDAVGIPF